MANNRTALDQAFDALLAEDWDLALGSFEEILREDPDNGMACLGRAMASRQIPSRWALAEQWDDLRDDPKFLEQLVQAREDFLPWLYRDMESLRASEPEVPELVQRLERASPGRKGLLVLVAVQVLLYLAVTALFMNTGSESDPLSVRLPGSLLLAAIVAGLPMILGPVYGNSLLKDGRFTRILRIVNNLAAVLGSLFFGIVTVAGVMSLSETENPTDHIYCALFGTVCLIYLVSLIGPMILGRFQQK